MDASPFDIFRGIDAKGVPTPEAAAALVTLARCEARNGHPKPDEARLGPNSHTPAAARWFWEAQRNLDEAASVVFLAAAGAVGAALAEEDADRVAVPVTACKIVPRLADLLRESPSVILPEGHILIELNRQEYNTLLDPRLLPEGHPLLAIQPAAEVEVDGMFRPALFLEEGSVWRTGRYPPSTASLAKTAAWTAYMRTAAEAMKERKAKERKAFEERVAREAREAQDAREVVALWSRDPSGREAVVRVAELEKQMKAILEIQKATAEKLAEVEAAAKPADAAPAE